MRFSPFGFLGSSGVLVDYLIVAGGGSGGDAGGGGGGGGGAGGYISGERLLNEPLSYSIVVGTGGVYVTNAASGSNGTDSSLFGFTAIGGGGGGGYKPVFNPDTGTFFSTPFGPVIGGSGGGGACNSQINSPGSTDGAEGTANQGKKGGFGAVYSRNYGGGGGGGAGVTGSSVQVDGGGTVTTRGNGGNGLLWVDGNYYAGGGGGSGGAAGADKAKFGGDGGLGGGGDGADGGTFGSPAAGSNGTANTGGGGGGGFGAAGGSGGSGIVKIRYSSATPLGTGGTITSGSGFITHTFTSSGDFNFTNQQS
jgi:hypothetical protein